MSKICSDRIILSVIALLFLLTYQNQERLAHGITYNTSQIAKRKYQKRPYKPKFLKYQMNKKQKKKDRQMVIHYENALLWNRIINI